MAAHSVGTKLLPESIYWTQLLGKEHFRGFGQGYYVWLPLWQFVLAGLYLATGIDTMLGGIVVSATSLGFMSLITVLVLKRAHFDRRHQILGATLLLTSGYLVAYASQGMTDVFSAMLLFGSTYYLFLYLGSGSGRYLAGASVLTLLNAMTRYEAWLFLVIALFYALYLFASRRLTRGTLFNIILYSVPSVFFILIWLYYNELVSGSFFGFASWISRNVVQFPPAFSYSPMMTLLNFAEVLLLSNGLFWLALVDFSGKETVVTAMTRFGALLFLGYSVFFLYSTYVGFSNGWVRLYLYFVPFSVVSFMSKDYRGEVFYLILGISIVLGILGFAQNAVMNQVASP